MTKMAFAKMQTPQGNDNVNDDDNDNDDDDDNDKDEDDDHDDVDLSSFFIITTSQSGCDEEIILN